MKLRQFSLLFCTVLGLFLAVSTAAQSDTFSDPNVEYTFVLPNKVWKMTTSPSPTTPNVEYTYGDRSAGFMQIRKLTVKPNNTMADVIADEEDTLKFVQGYVAGSEENFAGNLTGTVFNYEFISSGRNMSGRFYFLKVNPTTIYVLRFTGQKDKLIRIRPQTDSIARTFEIKSEPKKP